MSNNSQNRVDGVNFPNDFIPHLELGWAATSRYLRLHPIHRWFSFRHSFSPELIDAILVDWNLPEESVLLDPFVGAGTTLLSSKQHCYSAIGIDLSPLAILSTKVKVNEYDPNLILSRINESGLFSSLSDEKNDLDKWVASSDRLLKAFTKEELNRFLSIRQKIFSLEDPYQSFYLLALLAILPKFSRAVSDGGWFRWVKREDQTNLILQTFIDQINDMTSDINITKNIQKTDGFWNVILGDARETDRIPDSIIDGVITSPPYPNRHDYSRVFQIELLMLGETEQDIFKLRHDSLRSNVEASPPKNENIHQNEFLHPELLDDVLKKLGDNVDKRIPKMIIGYFEDIFLTLLSLKKSAKQGAKLAFVVGNVRHCGVMIPVDEIIVAIGLQLGFAHSQSWVLRLRGNSAQQMGRYGREPSRESVVMLQLLSK